MTALLRIVGTVWLAAILVVVMAAFGVTWAWRGWSAASALLDPGTASFAGVVLLSAPGMVLLTLARRLERRRFVRR